MTVAPDVTQALSAVMRADRGRILAALIARVRDFALAEDALQEAAASALVHWGRSGVPLRPEAWLIRVAFRKAIDRLRGSARDAAQAQALAVLARDEAAEDPEMIPDERLRLIFACCHPALEEKTRVALTLRSLCGLTTAQVAQAFLDSEPTMGQRLSRARAKIAANRIGLTVPDGDQWRDRLHSVLTVVYLIFTTGHGQGAAGHALRGEALFLARLLARLAPAEAEVEACLALILFSEARQAARLDDQGAQVRPQDQDRSLWDRAMLAEALDLLSVALARGRPGPMQWKAVIAAAHVVPPQPDWPQVRAAYDALWPYEPTPVVALNRAVAVLETEGPAAALALVMPLAATLSDYQPFHATLGEIHLRLANHRAAVAAFDLAIGLSAGSADALYLARRRDAALNSAALQRNPS